MFLNSFNIITFNNICFLIFSLHRFGLWDALQTALFIDHSNRIFVCILSKILFSSLARSSTLPLHSFGQWMSLNLNLHLVASILYLSLLFFVAWFFDKFWNSFEILVCRTQPIRKFTFLSFCFCWFFYRHNQKC